MSLIDMMSTMTFFFPAKSQNMLIPSQVLLTRLLDDSSHMVSSKVLQELWIPNPAHDMVTAFSSPKKGERKNFTG